ncbi:hypothetical protein [Methanothrix soehngenii]|uniref:hypothetical protein n=1 Tax=Methanothrix soehngenii TaxID=2223 RepID=UPI00300CBBCF
MLDEVFGGENFLNEIVWQRTSAGKTLSGICPRILTILFDAQSRYYQFFGYSKRRTEGVIHREHYRNIDESGRKFKMADALGKGQGP